MQKIDLHLHSVHSDGSMTPEQLSAEAAGVGANLISLTDHSTIAGVSSMQSAAKAHGIAVLTGVELEGMLTSQCEAHILAYGFDPSAKALTSHLADMAKRRCQRNEKIAARLKSLGIEIMEYLPFSDPSRLARTHFAYALVKSGVVKDMDAAFRLWLGRSGRAYFQHERPEASELLEIIRASGGISVLAHPFKLRMDVPEALRRLTAHGLGGVEAYYPSHSPSQTSQLLSFAKAYGLKISCGSDFHGAYRPGVEIACSFSVDESLQFWRNLAKIC